jgi:hypothetical protein
MPINQGILEYSLIYFLPEFPNNETKEKLLDEI